MSRSGAMYFISAIEAAAAGGGPRETARHAAAHRASAAARPGGSVLSRVRRMLVGALRSDRGAHGGTDRGRSRGVLEVKGADVP
jgi:type IV secretory pathway TrbL component